MRRQENESRRSRTAALGLCLAGMLLVSCSALMEGALQIGGNLLTAAAGNYKPDYGKEVKNLLSTLTSSVFKKKKTSGAPTEATADSGKDNPKSRPALELDVALLRQSDVDGQVKSVPIEDGEELKDGDAGGTGDRFKIYFKARRPCFVYVILVDGTGWVQPLFPGELSNVDNPMRGGETCFLPEGEQAFALDSHKGIETIYFLASHTRRHDLESMMRRFAAKERHVPPSPQLVTEPTVVSRGVTDTGPGTPASVQTRSGVTGFKTKSFWGEVGNMDLVVTRWFHHK